MEIEDNKFVKCKSCGKNMSINNIYCTYCGNRQNDSNIKIVKKSHPILNMLAFLLFFLIGFGVCFFTFRYLDDTTDNINYSNKSVTIDDTGIADSVEKIYDSVVVVESYVNGRLYGTGSGFVYKVDSNYGYILTNNHVIASATDVDVIFTTDSASKVKVDVVGKDEYSDVAVLRVAKKYVVQVAEIGSTDNMRVGDTTFAVGAPLDSKTYSWSVTRGILSGKNRIVSGGNSYMNVLQTDTPINSGNSGGPLCNANGEVIGITNMKLASDSIEGIGFAIPIETAVVYADQFVSGESVKRPFLGVSVFDGSESFFSTDVYVVVREVESGSPADKAGIKTGDIITKINGETLQNSSYFRYKLYSYKVGDTIKVSIRRDSKDIELSVTLGSN